MMPLIGLAPDTFPSILVVIVIVILVVVVVIIIVVILFTGKPDNDLMLIIISGSFINQQLIRDVSMLTLLN